MLVHTGIISQTDGEAIIAGLTTIQQQLAAGELTFTIENEDIHLNIETFLHELIGPVAGKLHTARSRNDQVATDMHLYLKEVVQDVITLIAELRSAGFTSRSQHLHHHAWLYPSATCTADFFCPSPLSLLQHADA